MEAAERMVRDLGDTLSWYAVHTQPRREQVAETQLRALGAVTGLNYSKGKWETLTLYERVP